MTSKLQHKLSRSMLKLNLLRLGVGLHVSRHAYPCLAEKAQGAMSFQHSNVILFLMSSRCVNDVCGAMMPKQ